MSDTPTQLQATSLDVLSIGGVGGWIALEKVAQELGVRNTDVRGALKSLGIPLCEAFGRQWVHPLAVARELVKRSFPDDIHDLTGGVDGFLRWLIDSYGAARRNSILESLRSTKRAFMDYRAGRPIGSAGKGQRKGKSPGVLRERGDRAGPPPGGMDPPGGTGDCDGDRPFPGDEGE